MSKRRKLWRGMLLLLCLTFVACAVNMAVQELAHSMELQP